MVLKGRKKGIFNNWNDVQESVLHYSGAIHKKFKIEDDAVKYMKSAGLLVKYHYYRPTNVTETNKNVSSSCMLMFHIYSYFILILYIYFTFRVYQIKERKFLILKMIILER